MPYDIEVEVGTMTSVTSPPVVVEVVHRNNDDGINDTTNRMRRELLSYRKARVINDDYIRGNSSRLMTPRSSNGSNRTRRVVTNDCMTKCETRSKMENESVHRMKQHLINYQKGKCLSISM